jgi:hypothetical protein
MLFNIICCILLLFLLLYYLNPVFNVVLIGFLFLAVLLFVYCPWFMNGLSIIYGMFIFTECSFLRNVHFYGMSLLTDISYSVLSTFGLI